MVGSGGDSPVGRNASILGDQNPIDRQWECHRPAAPAICRAARNQGALSRLFLVSVNSHVIIGNISPRRRHEHIGRNYDSPETHYAEDNQYDIHDGHDSLACIDTEFTNAMQNPRRFF
jgi:hypothetical protein